jgi:hypothetical protein
VKLLRIALALAALTTLQAVDGAIKAQESGKAIPVGARIFIGPLDDGFDVYLKNALQAKKVPVSITETRDAAQYEIKGHADTEKAGAAKKVIMMNWHSNEQASIQLVDLASGEVVYAYSVAKKSSAHGKQSTAEACAKHLKEKIESAK